MLRAEHAPEAPLLQRATRPGPRFAHESRRRPGEASDAVALCERVLHGFRAGHPSDYVLFPDQEGRWRLVGIPIAVGEPALKRPLPLAWAGLSDEALSSVVGVPGAKFCHENRFIAAFESETAARSAITRWGLDRAEE